jgi:alpha-amylase
MGDDMEKFGVWPETYKHCYSEGWLDNFFIAIAKNSDWLQLSTPSEYLAEHHSHGRADLPTASYTEMMEWVLPTDVRLRYQNLLKEFSHRPEVITFLRGGPWRAFFRKYSESNLLNKKMLRVSARLAGAPQRRASSVAAHELLEARDCLLRAQCNDAYWHGVFGGLYAPHLRTELWRNLIRAEAVADRHTPGASMARVETFDYDADGAPELLFTSPESQTLLKPSDGATVGFFDFRLAAATLINSVTRRPEAYHARVRQAATLPAGHVASIHDQTRVKEAGLDRFLRYDRWPRHSFRVLLFDAAKTHANYEALELHEDAGFAAGTFTVKSSSPHDAEFVREAPLALLRKDGAASPNFILTKRFSLGPAPHGCEISCEVTLKLAHPGHAGETPDSQANFAHGPSLALGIESVINFLAPDADDRFFESPLPKSNSHEALGYESRAHRSNTGEVRVLEPSALVVAARKEFLRFSGELPAPTLRIEDGWQKVRVTLTAPNVQSFWIAPIETVSESEEGFERVYQGSQILPVWWLNLADAKSWTTRLTWRLEHL